MDANCSDYVWNNPTLLLKSYYVKTKKTHCKTDVINHLLFGILVTTILGFIVSFTVSNKDQVVLAVLLFNLVHAVFWYFRLYTTQTIKKKQTENFQTIVPVDTIEVNEEEEEVIGNDKTYPSSKNPFMNVLVDEIKYNPTRSPAADIQEPFVSTNLDLMFKTQFINDPTDVFGRSQSQREFYTMPVTTVPSDQESYQNWLYRIPGLTCKEGGREACYGGTEGGVPPYLNNSS